MSIFSWQVCQSLLESQWEKGVGTGNELRLRYRAACGAAWTCLDHWKAAYLGRRCAIETPCPTAMECGMAVDCTSGFFLGIGWERMGVCRKSILYIDSIDVEYEWIDWSFLSLRYMSKIHNYSRIDVFMEIHDHSKCTSVSSERFGSRP